MIFTLLEDIDKIIRDFESVINVQYFKTGLFDSYRTPVYNSAFEMPNIGYALSGDWNRVDNYLITKKSRVIKVRKVPQRFGEAKFAVDQMINPKTIEIKLGGIYKENTIVAGRVATISEDLESLELYKLMYSKIKKDFKKIGAFYVGKTAEEKLREGWRLVTNEKSAREYDFSFELKKNILYRS